VLISTSRPASRRICAPTGAKLSLIRIFIASPLFSLQSPVHFSRALSVFTFISGAKPEDQKLINTLKKLLLTELAKDSKKVKILFKQVKKKL
ncbi:MAG: hypothetical protein WA992_05700, partial [Desulfobulbales bacterium]